MKEDSTSFGVTKVTLLYGPRLGQRKQVSLRAGWPSNQQGNGQDFKAECTPETRVLYICVRTHLRLNRLRTLNPLDLSHLLYSV